ncbi:hypothetical protein GGE12_004938 [Rhizobium mongolense]|uniref:Uncharacterized protein n=1 Tax=Rhizobium mongolense TaxID=57676 RepID=A0A7W6RSJ9_9HYPH|nr:hypothetical protein [Rhizobium mongolense]
MAEPEFEIWDDTADSVKGLLQKPSHMLTIAIKNEKKFACQ